jgi:NADH-quinone oxidoreductase subunit L
VLAYSTVSQLGYMFLGAGVGAFVGAIFHVFTHAFFKALLFLGSGSVIHGMHHEQEMPKMGGLAKYLPKTYRAMWFGWLAICGIPIFAGFFSKDEILWKTFSTELFGGGKVLWAIGFATAGMTAFYMTRLMSMTFKGEERFKKTNHDSHESSDHHGPVEPHESPRVMTLPLQVLAVFSTIAGLVGIPLALSFGKNINFFERWLEPIIVKTHEAGAEHAVAHQVEPIEYVLMALSVGVAILGIYLGKLFYERRTELAGIWAAKVKPLYTLSFNKWYLDWLLDVKGVEAGKAVNNALWKVDSAVVDGGVNGAGWMTRFWAKVTGWWDKWVIDLAVNATGWITKAGSYVLRTVQTGYWQNYALLFAAGLFVILLYYVFPAVSTTIKGFSGK